MAKLILSLHSATLDVLEERLKRFGNAPPTKLPASTAAILYLRAVAGRASIALANFYLQLGSAAHLANGKADDYPTVILAHAIEFSSRSTISLCCRKVFDHATTGMTGKTFSKYGNSVLDEVAAYWASFPNTDQHEAKKALDLIQVVLQACSQTKKELLATPFRLAQRVGLLKRHADAEAAHLTHEHYEFDQKDLAHVVAALAMIGALIYRFDFREDQANYFDAIDEAAWAAAMRVFPAMQGQRLFHRIDIAQQTCAYCRLDVQEGAQQLLEQLPYAIGWW